MRSRGPRGKNTIALKKMKTKANLTNQQKQREAQVTNTAETNQGGSDNQGREIGSSKQEDTGVDTFKLKLEIAHYKLNTGSKYRQLNWNKDKDHNTKNNTLKLKP